jgi:subtilisin family serine protease
VTGANRGIGRATALGLARLGATVLMLSRDAARGAVACEEVRRESGNADVSLVVADLASLASVRAAAADIAARRPAVHVLVNNAGVNLARRTVTPDGLEATLAVNHLAPFLLTNLLLPALRRGAPSRVVRDWREGLAVVARTPVLRRTALVAALVAQRRGLPGPTPQAVLRCQHKPTARAVQQEVVAEHVKSRGGEVVAKLQHAINGVKVRVKQGDLAALAAVPGVVAVRPVRVYRPVDASADNAVSVPFIGAPAAWDDAGVRGEGVKIAVIDTGIDYTHANFGGPGTAAAFEAASADVLSRRPKAEPSDMLTTSMSFWTAHSIASVTRSVEPSQPNTFSA